MRDGRPSWTAMAVAFGRGLGTEGSAPDPFAERFLPASIATALRAVTRLDTQQWPARVLVRGLTLGMVDHVCLRTAAIDRVICDAVRQGCSQLVLLGAGLDARAWRMGGLAQVSVFEVDHPATGAHKRQLCADLPCLAGAMRFVDVDFERQDLGEALASAGHNPQDATTWIWEGVTPYLHAAAIDRTLATLAARSAPGSVLAMTYALPASKNRPGLAAATNLAFRSLGEALRTTMEPGQAAARLEAHGFAPTQDTDARDWTHLAPGSASLARAFRRERLVVATRP